MIKKYLGIEYQQRLIGKGYMAFVTCKEKPQGETLLADSEREIKWQIKMFKKLFN